MFTRILSRTGVSLVNTLNPANRVTQMDTTQQFLRFFLQMTQGVWSIPSPAWKIVFLHKIPATRAAPRIFPSLHKMFCLHGTGQRELLPGQTSPRRTFRQNHQGRNFRLEKTRKFYPRRPRAPADFSKNIPQLPAIAAHHRLHLAVDAAVRTARKLRAVLTLRTLE